MVLMMMADVKGLPVRVLHGRMDRRRDALKTRRSPTRTLSLFFFFFFFTHSPLLLILFSKLNKRELVCVCSL